MIFVFICFDFLEAQTNHIDDVTCSQRTLLNVTINIVGNKMIQHKTATLLQKFAAYYKSVSSLALYH